MSKSIVLVTGSTGFVGKRLTETLLREGYPVRAFTRSRSKGAVIEEAGAQIFEGDVRDRASVNQATQGVGVVVHAAAGTREADPRTARETTIEGTRNIVDAAFEHGVERLIHISSCSVYGVTGCIPGQRIDELSPLEPNPDQRGHYSHAKFEAEQIVLNAMGRRKPSITCLRPGTIWGPGGELFTPMMGFKAGTFAGIIGNGDFILPLVYLDNLVSAIIKCIEHPAAGGAVFNVVDEQRMDKNMYTRKVLRPLFPDTWFFHIPYLLLHAAVAAQEWGSRILRKKPYLTRYRLISSQKPIVYDAGKICRDLQWAPPVDLDHAVRQVTLKYLTGTQICAES